MAIYINRIRKTQHLCFLYSCYIRMIQKKPICSNATTRIVESSTVEESLISIFTKRPLYLESPGLQELSQKITPQIVETVLKSLKNWRLAEMFFNWASSQEGYRHSCYTYNAMAAILSTARQNASLGNLALNALNSGIFWTAGALGYFLRCLGSQGLVKEANSLFDEVKNSGLCVLNNYSYNCLLEAISKSGDVGLMEYRLSEMRSSGWPIDRHALTPVLQCYCNAREFEKALMVFNELNGNGWVDQHVLTILVLSFSKYGEVDKAFELIEWVEKNYHTSLNEKTICVLIHGFVREGRVDKALQLHDKMKKVGYCPDISVYDVLIGALCKNKEIEKSLMLYVQMKESGVSPDVRILSKIISCNNLEVRDMIQLLEDNWINFDVRKRVLLYKSVLASLVNDGFVDKAYYLLRAAVGSGTIKEQPDTTSWQMVIDGLCSAGKIDMALKLFHDMGRCGCKRSVLIYNNLILCLSNADRLNECFDFLHEMKKSKEFQPTHFTFNTIFGCLCKKEDISGALIMLKEMRARGHEPWIKYCTLLVKKLCEHGNAIEARNFLANMTKEGFLPNMIAYSATIDGFLNMNELDLGLELFKEICERGYSPDVVAYNIIIKGLCKATRIIEAEELMNEMVEKGLVPSVVTYNLLIDGWCKNGNTDQAIACFLRMKEKEQEPSVITYTSLVDGLCNAGKSEDALSFWIEMESKGCDPNRIAYMGLIHGLSKCGKPDVASFYLQQMEDKNMIPDIYIYEALTDAFLSDSNVDMANKIKDGKAWNCLLNRKKQNWSA